MREYIFACAVYTIILSGNRLAIQASFFNVRVNARETPCMMAFIDSRIQQVLTCKQMFCVNMHYQLLSTQYVHLERLVA